MGNRTRVENVQGGTTRVARSTPNALNQITALSTAQNGGERQNSGFTYDVGGNLTQVVGVNGSKTLYSYDDSDRLTRIENRSAANVALSKSEFTYDFASRKVVSREFNYTNAAWVKTNETRRVFDGLDVIQERNAVNEVTAQYVRDGNIGGILARASASGKSYFHYDGGGNVTALSDENGALVGRYSYDAFGNTLEVSGARAQENPYRFSTKEWHAASGMYDYGFRFYSPGMGRWLNRDPIRESGGVNLYAMVSNSPVNSLDEYGLWDWKKAVNEWLFGKPKKPCPDDFEAAEQMASNTQHGIKVAAKLTEKAYTGIYEEAPKQLMGASALKGAGIALGALRSTATG